MLYICCTEWQSKQWILNAGVDDSDPSTLLFTAKGSRPTLCLSCSLQIVAQKKMVKPLLLKYGKYAGKSTITVGFLHCTYDLTATGEWNCLDCWTKPVRDLHSVCYTLYSSKYKPICLLWKSRIGGSLSMVVQSGGKLVAQCRILAERRNLHSVRHQRCLVFKVDAEF